MAERESVPKTSGASKTSAKTVGFRVSADYATWLEDVAGRNRSTVAGLLDQALAAYAKERGWPEPPPRS